MSEAPPPLLSANRHKQGSRTGREQEKNQAQGQSMTKKRKKLHGTVEKIIKPMTPTQSEIAQISVDEAEDLYKEIRIENVMARETGEKTRLRPGESVDVIVEADTDAKLKRPQT